MDGRCHQFILAELKAGKTAKREKIFFLTGGFIADEWTLVPDESGRIAFRIRAD